MLLAPSDRGPNSARPWNQPTIRSCLNSSTTSSTSFCSVVKYLYVSLQLSSTCFTSWSEYEGPRNTWRRGSTGGPSSLLCQRWSAAPRLDPVFPAAGCTNTCLQPDSRTSLETKRLLSATPPARQRASVPRRRHRFLAIDSTTSSKRRCRLHATFLRYESNADSPPPQSSPPSRSASGP